MSGGRASRQKGNRLERALVRALQDAGFAAERVPLSGAARGCFGGDVSVPLLGVDRRVEVKCRGNGFRQLYEWLAGADFLIVRADRREPLVVLPLKLATAIAAMAEKERHESRRAQAAAASTTAIDEILRGYMDAQSRILAADSGRNRAGRSR